MFFNRGSVSNFFQKASPIASNFFQKGKDVVQRVIEQAPGILGQVSSGLGTAGRLLDQASFYGGKIANNPELQNINSPKLQQGLSLINRGSVLAGQGSKLAHSADTFTNPDTYKGGHEANLTQALQRCSYKMYIVKNLTDGSLIYTRYLPTIEEMKKRHWIVIEWI